MKFGLLFAAVSGVLAASPDPLEIVLDALRANTVNEQLAREYGMTQETIERKVGEPGQPGESKSKTHEVIPLYGEPYRRLVRRDGRPLTPAESAREEQKLEDARRKRAAETPEQRRRRLQEYETKLAERRQMLDELPHAFTFQIAGEERLDGHDAWVIEAKPRPEYQPKSAKLSVLKHMDGRIHISKHEKRMLRVDIVTTGPVSFGWFLAKLGPGTRITLEQMRLPDGVYVVRKFKINYDVRVALVKRLRGETEQVMWDFRKVETPVARGAF